MKCSFHISPQFVDCNESFLELEGALQVQELSAFHFCELGDHQGLFLVGGDKEKPVVLNSIAPPLSGSEIGLREDWWGNVPDQRLYRKRQ